MKIENIIRLTGGVLLNAPSVNAINEIQIDFEKVQRENLFIDINNSQEEVELAIKNGAYVIISKKLYEIRDEEIAWINCEDINLVIIKLLRYFTSLKSLKLIPLSELQYNLSKYLHFDKKIITLEIDLQKRLMQILKIENETICFVYSDKNVNKIDPTLLSLKTEKMPSKIFKKSIFYTSFIYKERYYNDIKLPSIFISNLCALFNYLDNNNVEYSIDSFHNFENFAPIFIDKNFNKKDFGATEKALIFESNPELFLKELAFLEKEVNLSSLIVFAPKTFAKEFTTKSLNILYDDYKEINSLKNKSFRYSLIYGNIQNFSSFFDSKPREQLSLF